MSDPGGQAHTKPKGVTVLSSEPGPPDGTLGSYQLASRGCSRSKAPSGTHHMVGHTGKVLPGLNSIPQSPPEHQNVTRGNQVSADVIERSGQALIQ